MSSELMNFTYENHDVRTVMIDGEPWWVLKDVCDVLEIDNSRNAAARLEDDEKATFENVIGTAVHSMDGAPIPHNATLINEPGLYGVIMQSRKAEAKAFKYWITHEVLPQIRKTGSYGKPQLTETDLTSPEHVEAVLNALHKQVLALRETVEEQGTMIAVQGQQIAELKPKATYCDIVLQSTDLVKITVIAKDYGLSGRSMNRLLHDMGIQYRSGDIWLLYQEYAGYGYTSTKTHTYTKNDGTTGTSVRTYWTQKGRLWLYQELKKDGMLPLIEREAC